MSFFEVFLPQCYCSPKCLILLPSIFESANLVPRFEWSSFGVFVAGKALAKLQKAGTEGGKAAQNNKNISRVHVMYKKTPADFSDLADDSVENLRNLYNLREI